MFLKNLYNPLNFTVFVLINLISGFVYPAVNSDTLKLARMIIVADSIFSTAYNEIQNSHYKKSINVLNSALDLYKHSKNYAGIAKCNNWIAWNRICLSEFSSAIDNLLKNMEFIVNNNLKGSLEETVCLGMLGVARKDMGFYKQALECYDQELKIKINLLGATHLRVAATYSNMAIAYRKYGKGH